MAIQKTLEMDFFNELNKIHRFRVYDVKDDLVEQDIVAVMDQIIDANIFFSNSGELTSKKAARIVTREVIEYELM